jgi:Methyltransferase FkbM domain
VAAGHRPPELVKVDVEGAEDAAVRGMLDTLRRHRPVVVCEIHQARHETPHEVELLLAGCDYACGWLEEGMSRERTWWVPHVVARPR